MLIEVTLRRISLTSIIRRPSSRARSRELGRRIRYPWRWRTYAGCGHQRGHAGIAGKNRSCGIKL